MRMSNTYIPRLAGLTGLAGVDPHEVSGRVMVDGEPVLYAKAIMIYKGKTWIVSDDQDFIINNLGAPIGAIINGVLVPLDRMTDEQHAKFQPKYGYQRIPVVTSGPADGRLGFGFHISLPHVSLPISHIKLPSRQAVLKVGRVAAGAAAVYFTAGAAAAAVKGALPALIAAAAGKGGGAAADAGVAPDAGLAPVDAGVAPPGAPAAATAPRPAAPPPPAWMKWAMMAGAALLIL